ncbi:MAG TPA: DUF167 domain-containing protein [Acidimicrobiales bacterium]|nr:DUF167 domain-containing protein [Acidimicrobiales bacterium]
MLFDDTSEGPVLRVHVQPGASRSEVAGVHGDALKLRVAAPAIEGRANAAVLALLAEVLGVPLSALRITAGGHGRRKRVAVTGLDSAELAARLQAVVGGR